MSIRPLRTSEKLYALILLFYGGVQLILYHLEGATFLVGFGVGVWVCLTFMAILFSAFARSAHLSDPFEAVILNRGGCP